MEHHPFTWIGAVAPSLPEHTVTAVVVVALLLAFAAYVRPKLRRGEEAIAPEEGITARSIAEAFVEAMLGLAEGVIGHGAARYVPLLGSLFAFILIANLIGLIPGFVPPTSNSNITFALGLVSFLAYNAYGFRAQGLAYAKHFWGPVLLLGPLMLVIELFSHAFRPVSLGIRLYANMFADHKVVEIFTELTKVLVLPFYVLGTFVSVLQAFIFTMLTAIYIASAVSHDH